MQAARQGSIAEAVAAFDEISVQTPRYTIQADAWNVLCWQGGVWEQPERVIQACDRAVELDPESLEFQDSRGLVRALLGDTGGAIEDFEYFIENVWWSSGRKARRQGWVDALRAGEDPFTPELLAELRG